MNTSVLGGSFRQQNHGDDLVWVNNYYEVRVTPHFQNGITYLHLHVQSTSLNSLPVTGVSLQTSVASSAIAGVWTPSGRVDNDSLISAESGSAFLTYSAANYGIPYIAAADYFGNNYVAIGQLQQDLGVEIRATPLTGGVTELSLSAALSSSGRTIDQDFFVSNDKSYSWYTAAEAYADWVDAGTQYTPFPISSRAYEPVYDTWYWSQDYVDDALYVQTAETAAGAGLGTFLADSGWDAPAGEYNQWLMGRTGDYRPPPEKFSDLNQTFDVLRSQFHLQVQLWLQPFAVGRNSSRYAQTRAMHVQLPKGANSASLSPFSLPVTGGNLENVNLCPRVSSTHQYLKNLFTEVSTTYHPEAYWLDFIDGLPTYCVASHPHNFPTFGAGLRQALDTIRTTLLSLEQDPVVQFRAQYANLNNKPFANVWQPFDSPNNYERMRLDALRLRPFSKGVVFAADQLYWPSDADDETVSRFVMASVMSGVPSIGANLLELRPSSLEIVKNWMAFYQKFKDDLTKGRLQPFGTFRKPNHKIDSEDRLFAYIRSNNRVLLSGTGKKEIFLMNASDRNQISGTISAMTQATYDVQVLSRYVLPQGPPAELTANRRGLVDINAVVEPGGIVVLTRRD